MAQKFPKLFLILLAILFVLNLFQASFTELIYDEAYYWYYAQNLAWGYFDHPPMVAFLVKLSSFFFNGELGVRFMSILLSVGTYILLWILIDNPKKKDYVVHFFFVGILVYLDECLRIFDPARYAAFVLHSVVPVVVQTVFGKSIHRHNFVIGCGHGRFDV